jgi:hypothetical protein
MAVRGDDKGLPPKKALDIVQSNEYRRRLFGFIRKCRKTTGENPGEEKGQIVHGF